MASPFIMGLNGLVSRNVAGYVKKFELTGEWKEHELQEYAKLGRVPDESMMLNTLVRVAVERMDVLDSFRYGIALSNNPSGRSFTVAGSLILRCSELHGKGSLRRIP